MIFRDIRCQAAIFQHGRVLLAQMRASDGHTFWIAPGGGREGDESLEEAVRREVREETCLDVRVERLLFSEPDIPGGVYHTLHTYLCIPLSGQVQVGVEPEAEMYGPLIPTLQGLEWFDLRDPASWARVASIETRTLAWLGRVRELLLDSEETPA